MNLRDEWANVGYIGIVTMTAPFRLLPVGRVGFFYTTLLTDILSDWSDHEFALNFHNISLC